MVFSTSRLAGGLLAFALASIPTSTTPGRGLADIVDFINGPSFPAPGSYPANLTAIKFAGVQNVVFTATTASAGMELWRTDGTVANTVMILDIVPGVGSSNPQNLRAGRAGTVNVVYFVATTPAQGTEIWKTDGTAGGTQLISDVAPGATSSNPKNLTPTTAGGISTCYFTATTVAGTELWRTNGTAGTTAMITDIVGGPGSSSPSNLTPVMIGGVQNIMFIATTPAAGTELWRSNGVAAGTVLVRDIEPGAAGSNPTTLKSGISVPVNVVYFAATTAVSGTELWKSDGTNGGTVMIQDVVPGSGSSSPQNITASIAGSSDGIYFTATTAATGRELWRSNGTDATTYLVKDVEPGTTGSSPGGIVQVQLATNWVVLFSATTAASGTELWRSDGTNAGTVLVRDIEPGAGSSNPQFLKADAGLAITPVKVYFAATTTAAGRELWWSDSTTAGTALILDIAPGPASSSPDQFLTVDIAGVDTLFFAATAPPSGRGSWRSNGLPGGTVQVKDIK